MHLHIKNNKYNYFKVRFIKKKIIKVFTLNNTKKNVKYNCLSSNETSSNFSIISKTLLVSNLYFLIKSTLESNWLLISFNWSSVILLKSAFN